MDRYIITHDIDKVNKLWPSTEGFIVFDTGSCERDHRLYSEVAAFPEILNKYGEDDGNKWIQLNQYRRKFARDLYDRTAVPKPIVFDCSLAEHYGYFHNIEDLRNMGKAIKELYPHLVQHSERVLNDRVLIPYNICTCTVSQFRDYSNFLIAVLDKTLEYTGVKTYDEMIEHVKAGKYNLDYKGRNNSVEYQARVLSFLSERLASIYWTYISTQMPVYPWDIELLEEGQQI